MLDLDCWVENVPGVDQHKIYVVTRNDKALTTTSYELAPTGLVPARTSKEGEQVEPMFVFNGQAQEVLLPLYNALDHYFGNRRLKETQERLQDAEARYEKLLDSFLDVVTKD